MKFWKIFITFCLITGPVHSEILHLKNGDRLSGDITHNTAEPFIHIMTSYGLLQIEKTKIGGISLHKDAPILPITGSITETKRTLSNSNSEIAKTAPDKETNARGKTPAKWMGAKWKGNIRFGSNLRTGNAETSAINLDAQTTARWDKQRFRSFIEYNQEKDDGNTTVDDREIRLNHDYFVSQKWFVNNEIDLEQDDIEQLDIRSTYTLGVGYQPYDQDDLFIKMVLGPGIQYEDFATQDSNTNATLNWAFEYDQKFYEDAFSIFHNDSLQTPFDNTSEFLFQSETGLRLPLKRGIIATGQLEFDWDNAPAIGAKEEDIRYTLNLGYEW